MNSNDTKDYLYSRQHEYVKQIENKVKIACGAYVAAAVLILILPIFTAVPRGNTEMGYVETINWWAAGFALAAAVYGFIQYTFFDGADSFKYSPRFTGPAAVALGAILIFAGIWFIKGPELAAEYEGTDTVFDMLTTSYKINYTGPCTYLVCMAVGVILMERVGKSMDELIKIDQILQSGE